MAFDALRSELLQMSDKEFTQQKAVYGAICALLQRAGIDDPCSTFALHGTAEDSTYIIVAEDTFEEALEPILAASTFLKPTIVKGLWFLSQRDALDLVKSRCGNPATILLRTVA